MTAIRSKIGTTPSGANICAASAVEGRRRHDIDVAIKRR
jgi:hypothetical protein